LGGSERQPCRLRQTRFEFEVIGPITLRAIDTIAWEGEITALQWAAGGGWRTHPDPIRLIQYGSNVGTALKTPGRPPRCRRRLPETDRSLRAQCSP
jgi:hypothetical protein